MKIKVLLFGGILLAMSIWLLPVVLHSVGSMALYPLHITRVWLHESSDSLPLYLREKRELIERIQDLEQQLSIESGTRQSIRRLHAENSQLREQLDMAKPEQVTARVIARPNQLPYDVIQIDRGRRHGVELYAPVFSGVDQVVGFISHVADRYALVTLASTPGQRMTAYILGPDIFVTAEGVGDGMVRVRVPQGAPLAVDDLVILPAVRSGVFGLVTHIETETTEPQQYGYIPLPFSLQSLRYVSIGTPDAVLSDAMEIRSLLQDISQDIWRIELPELEIATTSATTVAPDMRE